MSQRNTPDTKDIKLIKDVKLTQQDATPISEHSLTPPPGQPSTRRNQHSTQTRSKLEPRTLQGPSTTKTSQLTIDRGTSKSNSKARTWESDAKKLSTEYYRVRKLITYLAPEQFRNPANPTTGPCNIFPTTLHEFINHQKFMAKLSQRQMHRNIQWMKDQIQLRSTQKRIESVLGRGGRTYQDGKSPVLFLPTIWSEEYQSLALPTAQWPTYGDLQASASRTGRTKKKPQRSLPAPKIATGEWRALLPLKEAGHGSTAGVEEDEETDISGVEWEERASSLIGQDLMAEIEGYADEHDD